MFPLKIFVSGKTIGIVDKDVTVIDLEKRPDKEKIIKELEQLTGMLSSVFNQSSSTNTFILLYCLCLQVIVQYALPFFFSFHGSCYRVLFV